MMKISRRHIVIVVLCVLVAGFNFARAEENLPSFQGYVNDYAGILSSKAKSLMTSLADLVESKTTAEIAVVTVQTVKPDTIEGYAVRLFEAWGIGKKGKDNGLLILTSVQDREVRVEVGYGLEGAITDAQSKNVIEKVMIPVFKKGDYDAGIFSAMAVFARIIAGEYGVELNIEKELKNIPAGYMVEERSSPLSVFFTFLLFIMIFGLRFGPMFFLMASPGRRGGYWAGGSGGSFGGGFGGFGGGFSGGGGASGSW